MTTRLARAIAAALVCSLAGCGGGGTSSLTPAHNASPQATQGGAQLNFVIPLRSSKIASARSVRPMFVSKSTAGAQIVVTGATSPVSYVSILDLVRGTVTSGGKTTTGTCTTTATSRSCTVTITVPIGTDVFNITTFDQEPSGDGFPSGAHILGIGSVTATVGAGSVAAIPIYIGGEVSSVGVGPAWASVPADGSTHTIALVIDPTDYDDNPIGGGKTTPFSNPISVTLSEHGGSGHTVLIFDGGASGTHATLGNSADTVSMQYDGKGAAGYYVSLSASATGAPTQNDQLAPLYVASASSLLAGTTLGMQGQTSNLVVTASEAGTPPSANTISAALTGTCANIATLIAGTATSSSAVFTVDGGTQSSASGCGISVKDAASTTLPIAVTNLQPYAGGKGGVSIAGSSIVEYPAAPVNEPGAITIGPNGLMWIIDRAATGEVEDVQTANSGLGGVAASFALTLPNTPGDIVAGPDGSLWVTNNFDNAVDRLTTAGAETQYQNGFLSNPTGITADNAGNLWFLDEANLWEMTTTGRFTQFGLPGAPLNPFAVALGPDNALYITDNGNATILRFDLSALTFGTALSTGTQEPQGIAAGSTSMWVALSGPSSSIASVSVGAANPSFVTTVALPASAAPQSILMGADNGVWFTESGSASAIGRYDLKSKTVSTLATPTTAAVPYGIALGPDGSIWFTEATADQVGHLIP